MRARGAAIAVAALCFVGAGPGELRADSFGGSGAHFFVARGVDAAGHASAARCGAAGTGATAVRGASLVTFQPDRGTAAIPSDAVYSPVGNLTVCYLPAVEETIPAVGVIELESGGESITIEMAGDCDHVPTVVNPETQLQSCSLTVTGSLADGVRAGLVTNNGLVARDAPATSVNTHVWTIFLIRN